MVETRRSVRHRLSAGATIECDGVSTHCIVRNISSSGAALEFQVAPVCADSFVLIVPAFFIRIVCIVVWRSQYRIGVRFE